MRLVKDDQVVITGSTREAAQLKASGFREQAKPVRAKKADPAPADKPAAKAEKKTKPVSK